MTQLTTIKMDNGQIQRLVNPFTKLGSVKFPAGTVFVDKDMVKTGEQVMKEGITIKLFFAFTGGMHRVFNPSHFTVKAGVTGNLYRHENMFAFERKVVFVGNPRIHFSNKFGGWKIVTVTEELIRHNGLEPEYEVVGEFKDGEFTSFLK